MTAQVEKRTCLESEALLSSQGAYLSAAVNQYAAAYGEESPERAWILSPFDTWERNPHYVGPEQPHPEADDGDYCDDGQGPREDYSCGGEGDDCSDLARDDSDEIPF